MNVTSLRRAAVPAAAAITLSLSLAACGSSSSSSTINGAGSTAQQSAQKIWAAGFKGIDSGVTVNYNPIGSGGGVTNFNSGAVVFAGSDAALDPTKGEVDAANKRCGGSVIEVPDYISAIAVAYNLPGVKDLKLDAPTIAKIFAGTITKWNDPAIANLNKGASLPSTAITPVYRSDKSGTTKNFTDYLSKAGNGAWTEKPNSVWPTGYKGSAVSGSSGVATALGTAGTIGYIDDSQATGLSKASIKVGSQFVQPSAAGAAKDVELSPKDSTHTGATDYAIKVDRTSTDPSAYPITLVSYLIACPSYAKSDNPDAIKKFLTYVVSAQGQAAAAQNVGSAPLPTSISSQATAWFSAIKTK